MSEYKVPIKTKVAYISNLALFIVSIVSNEPIAITTSIIVFFIISAEVSILEAIHNQGVNK